MVKLTWTSFIAGFVSSTWRALAEIAVRSEKCQSHCLMLQMIPGYFRGAGGPSMKALHSDAPARTIVPQRHPRCTPSHTALKSTLYIATDHSRRSYWSQPSACSHDHVEEHGAFGMPPQGLADHKTLLRQLL
jgi:hypothetical protein